MDSKKYVCKFCKKSFPCGRSLGGHIRSHMIRGNVKSLNKQPKLLKSGSGSGPGYELRENPKKTNKATDVNLISSSYSFSSWYTKSETEDGSDPNLGKRSGFIGGNNSNSSVSEVVEPHEEEVAVAMSLIMLSRDISSFPDQYSGKIYLDQAKNKMKKNKMEKNQGKCSVLGAESKISCKKSENLVVSGSGYLQNGSKLKEFEVSENGSAPNDQTNSVFSANDSSSAEKREKMKLAFSGHLQIVSKLKESEVSQNGCVSNDQVMKPARRKRKVTTPVGNKMGYLAFGEVENGSKMKEFEVSENGYASNDGDKRSKFECTSCDKIFHSYQALGGHRASHKKLNGIMKPSPHPKPESNDRKSMEKSHHLQQQLLGDIGIKVAQKHECPICFRIFPSGQALGGHKRSHLLPSNTNTSCINKDINEIQKSSSSEKREFLDLNLAPTTQEEEEVIPTSSSSNNLVGLIKPYWWVESHKHDLLLGLISN